MGTTAVAWAEVTIDCCDMARVAGFWSELLGVDAEETQPEGWIRIPPLVAGGPRINFQPVAEAKVGKARVHLDLWTAHLQDAVDQVRRLGGRMLDEVHVSSEGTWVVMADPEGTEFCLVGIPGTPAPQ